VNVYVVLVAILTQDVNHLDQIFVINVMNGDAMSVIIKIYVKIVIKNIKLLKKQYKKKYFNY
jgi:hypothetical protein